MNRVSHPRAVSGSSKDNSDDQQQLSDLISVIYEAAIDPSRWEDAIVSIVQFVGGAAGGLFCKDVGASTPRCPIASDSTCRCGSNSFGRFIPPRRGTFSAISNSRSRRPI